MTSFWSSAVWNSAEPLPERISSFLPLTD
ncbi:unnamed protein product [Chondrus crispus]|uniref:Uncharacterized protein n=1 Tax=Chondrus crispus TaxID=2769 RepID=S0F3X2_CHOCR|nr:unnamed protein product [Chondrus crispus]CDF77578.1 unnamed protein product [Chondrus crispus]|eukprot:XP_005718079.1 unnamed protein product [Chondrus crispus]